VRFAFGSILIVPSAALMGASFPLIACAVDRSNGSQGRSWLRAYALNLTGAVLAALSGAYVILPLAGIRGALWLCFGICAFVFVGCQFATPGNPRLVATEDRQISARLDHDARILLTGAFASGFVFFALEVLWTHLVGIAVGGSVYAFSAMLTMVLLGLLIGAFRVDRISRRQVPVSYSRIFQLAALLLVIQLRMWDWGQAVFLIDLPAPLQNFFAVETIKLALAAVLIVPSAAMLGAIYPCLLRSPVLERPEYSYLVGYLNTWNSLGCLMGAVAGIFFLIPLLGAEWSLKLIIVTALAVSLLFLWRENPSRKALNKALAGVAIVLLYAAVCKWDKRLIASGMNVYFGQVAAPDSAKQPEGPRLGAELIFFDESAQGGITSVVEFTDLQSHAKERVLLTNGKYEGSDDLDNQGRAQIGFAAIPSMFNAEAGRALLIGLGTGHSALALTRVGYREVDVAEFAPGIIRASRQVFPRLTEGALDFPNVSVKLEDGHNLLLTKPLRAYDLITVEITSVWFAGATNVYSREFYQLAKQRLRPRGVLQQWVQLHHISPREVESEIATVRSVFPYVSFWYFGGQGFWWRARNRKYRMPPAAKCWNSGSSF
jgi:spermidine synthase